MFMFMYYIKKTDHIFITFQSITLSSLPRARSAFPDVTVSSARPGPGNLGENLTEWEGSPSSDQDTDMLQPFLASHIKYIPINYFQVSFLGIVTIE